MSQAVPFASFYVDRSNSLGFQWEFFCERCGNGYKSTFQTAASVAASAGGMLTKQAGGELTKRAKGLLPGFVGDFVTDKASDMVQDRVKESALEQATAEVANAFALCPRCHRWRCRAACWNLVAGLCLDCAPAVGAPLTAGYGQPAYPNSVPPSFPIAGGYNTLPGTPQPYAAYGPPSGQMYAPQAGGPPPQYGAPQPPGGYATGTPGQYAPYAAPASVPLSYQPPSQPHVQPQTYAPQPYVQPQPYVPQPYAAVYVVPRASGLAVASLIAGLLEVGDLMTAGILAADHVDAAVFVAFAYVLALFAIVFGHVAHGQIKRGGGVITGRGMATTGLVLGYLLLGGSVLLLCGGVLLLPFLMQGAAGTH